MGDLYVARQQRINVLITERMSIVSTTSLIRNEVIGKTRPHSYKFYNFYKVIYWRLVHTPINSERVGAFDLYRKFYELSECGNAKYLSLH